MKKDVTVKDIANELNVSLSTVHKALTGKSGISEKRRKQVLVVAQTMGYEVNSIAQSLARKSMNLGIIMPSTNDNYFDDMKSGMSEESERLKKYRVQVLFYEMDTTLTRENIENMFVWLEEQQIDALIYCSSVHIAFRDVLPIIKRVKVPLFFAGEECYDVDSVTDVAVDHYTAGKLAADFLRCVERDNLRAAVFLNSMKYREDQEKVNLFVRRVEKAGGVVAYLYETENDSEKIRACMEQLSKTDVNAIYVSSRCFLPVCQYLEEHDLSTRYSVVCSGYTEELRTYMKEGLVQATIGYEQDEVGKMAVRMAYEYLVAKSSYKNKISVHMLKHSDTGYYLDLGATRRSVVPVAGMKIGVQGILSDGMNQVEFLPATFEYDGNGKWEVVSRENIISMEEQDKVTKVTVSWNTSRQGINLFMTTDKTDTLTKIKEALKWTRGGVYINGEKTSQIKSVVWIQPRIRLLTDVE